MTFMFKTLALESKISPQNFVKLRNDKSPLVCPCCHSAVLRSSTKESFISDAGYITSGDKHILSEKERLETRDKKLKILTKSEFERKIMK